MAATAVDPERTFAQQIIKTSYSSVLNDDLQYEVYVHRAGLSGNCHHKIVLRATQYKLGFISLELCKSVDNQVKAESIMFNGDPNELESKGTIQGRLTDFAQIAMEILIEMGKYLIVGNNCQNFCNKFLEKVGRKEGQYYTTSAQVGTGIAVGLGVLAAALATAAIVGLAKSGNEKKDRK